MRELERNRTDIPLTLPAIAIVGAGRVGGAIAGAAAAAGITSAVAGRGQIAEVCTDAEVALLCVPDAAIEEACSEAAQCIPPIRFVGHTSGATGLDVLDAARERGAGTFSIHPLQTVPDSETMLSGTPCAVSASSPAALGMARALAESLGMVPFEIPEERRAAYHAAASMASNFLVALEESASLLLEKAGLDNPRELLSPLVLRSAANWSERGPEALTGPIARGDRDTVERHVAALRETAPELLPLYETLAERTAALAGRERPQMSLVRTKDELRSALAEPRRRGARIGLVPTMGAFHEGHLSLMRAARLECDVVVVTLFVNPAQFRPGEDLEAYPRDLARDMALAEGEGVDLLFAPDAEEVYPPGFGSSVEVSGLTDVLCGDPSRRGSEHFRGVTNVVAKLFNCVQPQAAFFGQKDAQQALVIGRMARDLDFPVEIRVVETAREPDGLAMSSRNAYLDEDERRRATSLRRALRAIEEAAESGTTSIEELLRAGRSELDLNAIDVEYLEIRNAEDLSAVARLADRPVLVAIAARVGETRLIDNTILDPTAAGTPTPTEGTEN